MVTTLTSNNTSDKFRKMFWASQMIQIMKMSENDMLIKLTQNLMILINKSF